MSDDPNDHLYHYGMTTGAIRVAIKHPDKVYPSATDTNAEVFVKTRLRQTKRRKINVVVVRYNKDKVGWAVTSYSTDKVGGGTVDLNNIRYQS